jgi:hypothetical protein
LQPAAAPNHHNQRAEYNSSSTHRAARDAAEFIKSLPKASQDRPEWQILVKALLLVVECRDTLLARIGIMRALNAGTQWSRRCRAA